MPQRPDSEIVPRRQPASRSLPMWKQRLGLAAERHAEDRLRKAGCEVLARRFRSRRGEIDLVVRDGPTVVFVEVKARRGSVYGHPAEAVTAVKQRQLRAAARLFLRQRGLDGSCCRFDVVCVEVGSGRARLEWIRDAFSG